MADCQVCAQNKESHTCLSGLLYSLPIPSYPWSHLSLDFLSGLQPTQGMTVIQIIMYSFLKSCKFIPLPKHPSANETAQPACNMTTFCQPFLEGLLPSVGSCGQFIFSLRGLTRTWNQSSSYCRSSKLSSWA